MPEDLVEVTEADPLPWTMREWSPREKAAYRRGYRTGYEHKPRPAPSPDIVLVLMRNDVPLRLPLKVGDFMELNGLTYWIESIEEPINA